MGSRQGNTTLGFKYSKKGKSCIPSRFFFLVVVVIINQIVTEQRIGVKAKPWQESQQSNETQVSEMSLWGVPPKHGHHTGTRQPRYWHFSWKATRKQGLTSLLLILVLKQEELLGKWLVGGRMVPRLSVFSNVTWSPEVSRCRGEVNLGSEKKLWFKVQQGSRV